MGRVESDSILRNTLRDLRRIEFSEIVRQTSLGADSRAFSPILCDFGFLRSECPEFYVGFYVELAWNLHGHGHSKGPELMRLRVRED
jgi:hypothetical protein